MIIDFVPIVLFICITTGIIITTLIERTAKHKERMALIENGMDASIFEKSKKKKKIKEEKPTKKYSTLKYGMLAVGLGLGLVLGTIISSIFGGGTIPHIAMMLICGGGALISYYNIVSKREEIERDRKMFDRDNELV